MNKWNLFLNSYHSSSIKIITVATLYLIYFITKCWRQNFQYWLTELQENVEVRQGLEHRCLSPVLPLSLRDVSEDVWLELVRLLALQGESVSHHEPKTEEAERNGSTNAWTLIKLCLKLMPALLSDISQYFSPFNVGLFGINSSNWIKEVPCAILNMVSSHHLEQSIIF